jgi:hypothetical protein
VAVVTICESNAVAEAQS